MYTHQRGISLVEVVIVAGIFAGAIVTLLNLYASQTMLLGSSTRELQAALLLEEGVEIVRYMRDQSWDGSLGAYVTGGSLYYFDYNDSTKRWNILAGSLSTYIDDTFDRYVRFYTVSRDSVSQDIVTSGGVVDSDARRVEVVVEWNENGATTSRSISTYFINVFKI